MALHHEIGTPGEYNSFGCSPKTLTEFCNWLISQKTEIQSIDIAMYLFNNNHLYSTLKELSLEGVNINIITIPLEGYDNDRPINITDYNTKRLIGRYTKLDLATPIYEDIKDSALPNLKLYIFPHMYLRSPAVNPFSRGSMPYSLHCKTFKLVKKNSDTYIGLTSSNLAVRDAQKLEIAYVTKIENAEIASANSFYQGLIRNSIEYALFDPAEDYSHYSIQMQPSPAVSRLMFTAPFFASSSANFEHNIITMLNYAKKRIIISAQHICAYNYTYNGNFDVPQTSNPTKKPGFLSTVLEKAASGIKTLFISQTYVDATGDHGCRKPENKSAFIDFAEAAKKIKNCSYYVNENLHAKYIVIDDMVIITTCNFTPSQFIYLPNVDIPSFTKMPDLSYSGIFCEVGVYFVTQDKALADSLSDITDSFIAESNTKKMFP